MNRTSFAVLFALGAAALVAGAALVTDRAAGAGTATLTPVADTYVRSDRPAGTFGLRNSMQIDTSPQAVGYLRFDVTVPAGETVTQATLGLFPTSGSSVGFTVHGVTSTSWGETTTTYANAPAVGAQVGSTGSYLGRAYVPVDVTSLVTAGGPVSFAVRALSSSAELLRSRESSSGKPQLLVETAAVEQTIVYALGDGADGSTTSGDLADYVIAQSPDRFFYLGDVYETGTATEFANNYEPLYGALASVTDPVIGNHEYANRATGYYPYWMNKRGWTQEQAKHRSYVDAASGWQIIAYSSETDMAAEGTWVAGEVAKHAGTCRIVMAHKGRHVVVDTAHGDNTEQESVWAGVTGKTALNLVGHNHIYGRLAPVSGVTVVVSGAGGHGLRTLGVQHHTVDASKTGIATATRLVLRPGAADFAQVDKDGTVHDSGTVSCTPAP